MTHPANISESHLQPIWLTDSHTTRPYFLIGCAFQCGRILKNRGDPSGRFTGQPSAAYPPICHRCRREKSNLLDPATGAVLIHIRKKDT